jgi:hypothetical protein
LSILRKNNPAEQYIDDDIFLERLPDDTIAIKRRLEKPVATPNTH